MTSHLETARKLKNEFNVKEAAVEFEKAFKEDNGSIEAAGNAGLCYTMMGELDKALDFFNKALAINREDELVALYVAMLEVAKGSPYKETTLQDKNISVSEQFMTTSEMLFYINKTEESFRLFETILTKIKDDSWLMLASNQYRIVTMLARFGLFEEAKSIADSLAEENPKTWHGYASQAQIELEREHIDEAKALFKKAMLSGGDKEPLLVTAIADTRLLKVSKKDYKKEK